jgi:hypothetical protein
MVEGPMNIDPKPLDLEVETNIDAAESVEKQQTGLTDVDPGTLAHFPTHAPRLHAGGQRTLNALRPKR